MTKSKKLSTIAIVFICLMLCASISLSAITLYGQSKANRLIEQNYGETEDINQEDDITIADNYVIKSTLQISDAYKSGDVSKLDDTDKETLDMAKAVIDEVIKKDMSDYEKEKAIYEYLVTGLESTTGILTVVPAIEQENDNPHDVLKYRSAVCVGYATTFRMFMQMLDIECKVIHNKELFHSWNLVNLDGDWYHVDCYSDNNATKYLNFNMNDTQSSMNHDWTREFFPSANGIKYNYVLSVCEQIKDFYQIPEWLFEAIEDRKSVISCTFKKPITEKNQYAAKLMTDNLVEGLFGIDDYSVECQWSQNEKGDYVLSFFITYYKDEENKVDEKTTNKINEAINDAMEKYVYKNAVG